MRIIRFINFAVPALLITALLLVVLLPMASAQPETAGVDPADIYLPVIFDGAGFGPGTVTGHVIDAVEGTFLDGVEICYFNNDACEYTDENGEYTFTNMPSGYRIFTAEGENFAELTQGTGVFPGEISILNFALSPDDLEDVGQYRIVVIWDEDPKDLDAHLWTPDLIPHDIDGDGIDPDDPLSDHIWNAHKANCSLPGVTACLDKDNRNGFGPETITIKEAQTGTYAYAVQRFEPACGTWPDIYACPTPLEGSGARVQLYDYTGVRQDAFFQVPTIGNDAGYFFWYVFDIEFDVISGELGIVTHNCFTDRPDPIDDPPTCPTPP